MNKLAVYTKMNELSKKPYTNDLIKCFNIVCEMLKEDIQKDDQYKMIAINRVIQSSISLGILIGEGGVYSNKFCVQTLKDLLIILGMDDNFINSENLKIPEIVRR